MSFSAIARELGLQIVHLESWGYPAVAKKPTRARTAVLAVKSAIKRIPGMLSLNDLRRRVFREGGTASNDARTGSYSLFCILRKR